MLGVRFNCLRKTRSNLPVYYVFKVFKKVIMMVTVLYTNFCSYGLYLPPMQVQFSDYMLIFRGEGINYHYMTPQ